MVPHVVRVLQPRHQICVIEPQPHVPVAVEPDQDEVHRHRHVHRSDRLDSEVGCERLGAEVPSSFLVLCERLLPRA